eukprot:CAMPEP_0119104016 /NCGR_PEP_ID=MMETSP1180-20130426/2334_1 /TAXON_ID=3052 ORGANISM="Chlamydomonas cf sp, Strain CCMP681" /NCGR_SAMPLE_ID=MMETSP1180 /ASSEMBLY_ACC=CAM_ASM_000741 /LENGTH=197 /DNA_ID=CAMNT_0007088671 /DNA_START=2242 /DNA_END=2835 /DNA_ORIENTATION=+
MHAHSLANHSGLAPTVVHNSIKVFDMAQAITPKLQGVGREAKTVIADIHGRFAGVGLMRISIRHYHLHQGSAVKDGPQLATLLPTHLMQHQALATVEAHTHLPVLPLDQVSVNQKGRPLRLQQMQRAQARAEGDLHQIPVVFMTLGWQRWGALVLINTDDTPRIEIHDGHQIQWVRILVVILKKMSVHETLEHASSL